MGGAESFMEWVWPYGPPHLILWSPACSMCDDVFQCRCLSDLPWPSVEGKIELVLDGRRSVTLSGGV